jgi:DNA-binding CsgD family transcriptional regulator
MPNSIDLPSLLARLRAAVSTPDCLRVLVDSRSLAHHAIVGFREQLHVPAISRMPRPQWWAERMGWPAGFMQEWIRRNLAGLNPALSGSNVRVDALASWTLPDPAKLPARGSAERARLAAVEFLGTHDIREGLVAAVRRSSGHLGYVSWLRPTSRQPLSVAEARGLVLLAQMYFDALDRVRPQDSSSLLSPMELRCLSWVAYGCTDKEIAAETGRAVDTVRFHVKNILKKLGAANRTHAVALAMQQGLIRLGGSPQKPG